jgi:hypothetical protein
MLDKIFIQNCCAVSAFGYFCLVWPVGCDVLLIWCPGAVVKRHELWISCVNLVLWFSRLKFNARLRFSGMRRVECWSYPFRLTLLLPARSSNPPICFVTSHSPFTTCSKKGFQYTPNQYLFTLKMATAVLTETLEDLQHSTRLILENWTPTLLRKCDSTSMRKFVKNTTELNIWSISIVHQSVPTFYSI